MRIRQVYWGIETAGWSIDQSPECVTLCPADIEAALQFSCHRKQTGDITVEELRDFARERLPADVSPSVIRCGEFDGVVGAFVDDGAYWRNWWLAHGKTHLFVTYNCDEQDQGQHDEVVSWMLSTLEALDA